MFYLVGEFVTLWRSLLMSTPVAQLMLKMRRRRNYYDVVVRPTVIER